MNVLVFSLSDWAINSVFVTSLAREGFEVSLLSKRDFYIARNADVRRRFVIGDNNMWGVHSVLDALVQTGSRMVFPTDELALYTLHRIVDLDTQGRLRARYAQAVETVRASLPSEAYMRVACNKSRLLALSAELGFRTPENRIVETLEAAKEAAEAIGYPVVLKLDYSFGGNGVRYCESPEALAEGYAEFSKLSEFTLSVQQVVHGLEANHNFVALEGRVLQSVTLGKLNKRFFGPADTNQVMHNAAAEATCNALIETMGYNGFGNMDIIIDEKSGEAYVLEMNARKVPHITFGLPGLNLIRTLLETLEGREPTREPCYEGPIGIFPLYLINYPERDEYLFDETANTVPLANPVLLISLLEKEAPMMNEPDRARTLFERLAERHGENASMQLAAAELNRQCGRDEAAERYVQSALALAPSDSTLRLLGARMLRALDNDTAALAACEGITPDAMPGGWTLFAAAELCEALGRGETALAFADALLAREPGHAGAWDVRARLSEAAGEDEAALSALKKLLECDRGNAQAWTRMHLVKERIGLTQEVCLHLSSDDLHDIVNAFDFAEPYVTTVGEQTLHVDAVEAAMLQSISLERSMARSVDAALALCNERGLGESFSIGKKLKTVPFDRAAFAQRFDRYMRSLIGMGVVVNSVLSVREL